MGVGTQLLSDIPTEAGVQKKLLPLSPLVSSLLVVHEVQHDGQ
jgi:hypothetical protein